jgi:stage III sporulation protein AD
MGGFNMIKIAVVGIIAIILAIIFKKGKEEYSLYISIAACVLILIWGVGKLEEIFDAIDRLQGYIQLNKSYVSILMKIIGITYVTEIAAALCRDSGYQAIGEQIEMVGKLTILAISMPIMLAILDTINNLMRA